LPHLKVIPKGPVPQHLEEGVMVSISTHILQVVVLPSRTHALLAVHHPPVPRQLAPGVRRAQENGLELQTKAETSAVARCPPDRGVLRLGLPKHRNGSERRPGGQRHCKPLLEPAPLPETSMKGLTQGPGAASPQGGHRPQAGESRSRGPAAAVREHLIHARVDEEQARVAAGPHRGRGQAAVAVALLEEAEEGSADLPRRRAAGTPAAGAALPSPRHRQQHPPPHPPGRRHHGRGQKAARRLPGGAGRKAAAGGADGIAEDRRGAWLRRRATLPGS